MTPPPNCSSCGQDYITGHTWRGGKSGACKTKKGSVYTAPTKGEG